MVSETKLRNGGKRDIFDICILDCVTKGSNRRRGGDEGGETYFAFSVLSTYTCQSYTDSLPQATCWTILKGQHREIKTPCLS
jgi:hypothetical protein